MASEFRCESTAREAAMVRVLQELQGTIHFVIDRLGKSQVPENTVSETCRLVGDQTRPVAKSVLEPEQDAVSPPSVILQMMPTWFVQEHGDKLQEVIVLRSTSSSIPCRVRLRIYNTTKAPAIKFGRGWRDFATCNGLVVGDSLIFELRGLSQFEVYVFRGTRLPIEIISSSPNEYCSPESEISQNLNGNRFPNLVLGESSEGSEDIDLCEAVARKRKARSEDFDAASQLCARQKPSGCIKLRLSELENVQVTSTERLHSQQPPVVHQLFGMPISENRHSSQYGQEPRTFFENVSTHENNYRALRNGDIKLEMIHQPAKVSLPSFICKLAEYNVRDSAGNTSGAHFTVPLAFVKTHGIRLQAHVKLQGTHEASPSRMVTCSYDMVVQDGEGATVRRPLSLGWGDFVRDNALRAGQELVFTLASESSFVVREVSEIVIYTK